MAFQISFGGVPFALDDQEIVSWIEHNMPLRHELFGLPLPNPWNGKNLYGLLGDTLPHYPRFHIGDWFYPWGASRWSVFHGLATKSQAAAMMALALPNTGPITQPFIYQADAFGNPAVEGQTYQLQSPMWMLAPRVLAFHSPGTTQPGEALYLVTLVDTRYWWSQRSGTDPAWHFPANTTWVNLLTALKTELGANISYPAINSVYGQPEPDSDLYTNYENPAVLLDAIAANIGCVVCRNLDDTYNLLPHVGGVNGQDSVTSIKTSRPSPVQRISGGNMLSQPSIGPDDSAGPNAETAAIPASITVTFPKFQLPGGAGTFIGNWLGSRPGTLWIQDSYNDVWAEVVTAVQAGVANPVGISANTFCLHDTAKAIYYTGNEAQPVNEATLRSLAIQMAKDVYNAAIMGLDETYPGTLSWPPEGLHDILYSYRGATGQAMTRVIPRPWNYGPVEFQHNVDGSTIFSQDRAAGINALVQVLSASPQGDNTYNAQLVTIDPVSLAVTAGKSIWFYDPNLPGQMVINQIFLAKPNGTHNARPLYIRDDFRLQAQYDDASGTVDFSQTLQLKKKDFVLSSAGARKPLVITRGWPGNTAVGDSSFQVLRDATFDLSSCTLTKFFKQIDVTDGLIQNVMDI